MFVITFFGYNLNEFNITDKFILKNMSPQIKVFKSSIKNKSGFLPNF